MNGRNKNQYTFQPGGRFNLSSDGAVFPDRMVPPSDVKVGL